MVGVQTPISLASLEPAALAGFTVEHHATIGSTNDRALELARQGQGQTWVVADRQEGGRGRSGRNWSSPTGNFYASLSLVDPCPMAVSPQLSFVAGVAIFDAVQSLTGCGARLAIKWPNDLLLDGAKLSGLLLEGGSSGASFVMTVGIGLNLVTHPADTPYRATDLATAGYGIDRDDLLAALCISFRHGLELWNKGQGFAAIRAEWLQRAAFLNERITISSGHQPRHGIFETLDPHGRLVLATEQGRIFVEAGDLYPLHNDFGS